MKVLLVFLHFTKSVAQIFFDTTAKKNYKDEQKEYCDNNSLVKRSKKHYYTFLNN